MAERRGSANRRTSGGSTQPRPPAGRKTIAPGALDAKALHKGGAQSLGALLRKKSLAPGHAAHLATARATLVVAPGTPKSAAWVPPPVQPQPTHAPEGAPSGGAGANLAEQQPSKGEVLWRIPRRQIRLNDPQSRLTFLKEHPFFQDTSVALRERLAPQLVKRSAAADGAEILTQGEEPTGDMDYLFLTAPEANAKVEVFFEGRPVALLGGSCIFGQEVIFGVAKRFVFTVRIAAGSTSSLWVVPRAVVQAMLQKEGCRADAGILRERAHTATVVLLHNWYRQPTTPIKLRLFENAARDFKSAFVEAMVMDIVAAGSSISEALVADQETCFCIFRGEAKVLINGEEVTKLSQQKGTSAWGAWWGMLDVLGVASNGEEEVTADTDCIVWRLGLDRLKALHRHFPQECRQFEKVAVEHLRLLQRCTTKLEEGSVFQGVAPVILEALSAAATDRICKAGEAVIRQGEDGDQCFFLARGKVTAYRGARAASLVGQKPAEGDKGHIPFVGAPSQHRGMQPLNTLGRGAVFGEMGALGLRPIRGATVVCDTPCHIRVLPQCAVVDAIEQDRRLGEALIDLAKERGFVPPAVDEDNALFRCFPGVSNGLLEKLRDRMVPGSAFRGQVIMEQGSDADTLYILLSGQAVLEIDKVFVADIRSPVALGDIALVQPGSKHIASARCGSYCKYLSISMSRMTKLLQDYPHDKRTIGEKAKVNIEALRKLLAESLHHKEVAQIAAERRVQLQDAPEVPAAAQQPVRRRASLGRTATGPLVFTARESEGAFSAGAQESFVDSEDLAEAEAEEQLFREVLQKYFKDSDERFCEVLIGGMQKTIYFDGQVILKEGDEGDFALIIQRGSGVVEVGGIRVGEVKEGGLVGEAVLLGTSARRTATVRAVGMVSAFTLQQSVVLAAFEEFPEEKKKIEEVVRLRRQANQALTKSSQPPPESKPEDKSAPGAAAGGSATLPDSIRRSSLNQNAQNRRVTTDPLAAPSPTSQTTDRATFGEPSPTNAPKAKLGRSLRRIMAGAGRYLSGTLIAVAGGPSSAAGVAGEAGANGATGRETPSSHSRSSVAEEDETAASRSGSKQRDASKRSLSKEQAEPKAARKVVAWRESVLGDKEMIAAISKAESEANDRNREHLAWARRRQEAVRTAQERREMRQAYAGVLTPLVPPSHGYQAPSTAPSVRSPWAEADSCMAAATVPWKLRLKRAEGIYKPPVWHEVFG